MYLRLLVELIHNLNKRFNPYETLLSLAHYHIVYLILKLI
jgi:hypothetical protein